MSAEQVRAIARRAVEALERGEDAWQLDPDEDRELVRKGVQRWRAAMEALRFCARAAGVLGDPSLLRVIVEALEIAKCSNDEAPDDVDAVGEGLAALLAAGAPITDEIRALARHPRSQVRQAVASGLAERKVPREADADADADADAVALREALAADPVFDVRAEARRGSGERRAVAFIPWWAGRLVGNPATRLAAAAATLHAPALARIATLLDAPAHELPRLEDELVTLARTLPDPLPVELAESTLSSVHARGPLPLPRLGALMLERPGGAQALVRLCARWSEVGGASSVYAAELARQMVAGLEAAPEPQATPTIAVCLELATRALSAQEGDGERTDGLGPAQVLAGAVGGAWPAGADLTPLLEVIRAAKPVAPLESTATRVRWPPAGAVDPVVEKLAGAFTGDRVDPDPILRRVLEARLAGYPGRLRAMGHALDALLDRAPRRTLRAAALRALAGRHMETLAWAIERLSGPLHDPDRDPPHAELVRDLFAEPRFRKAFARSSDLARRALPLLRAELRAGRLDLREALATLGVVEELYGGLADSGFFARRGGRSKEAARRALREELRPYLGPADLAGPVTETEWRAYRDARARHRPDGYRDYLELLLTLPDEPWSAEDRALLERAVGEARQSDPRIALAAAIALAAKPDRRDLALMDALCELDPRRYGARRCRKLMRAKLGVRDAAPADATPASGPISRAERRAWMDEPE